MKRRLLLLLLGAAVLPAAAADNYSSAEQALFLSDHLGSLKPPLTLRYGYRKSGTLEPGFDDRVSVALARQADGSCCAASALFLQAQQAVPQGIGDNRGPKVLDGLFTLPKFGQDHIR